MFDWLKPRDVRHPEARWVVSTADERLDVRDADGRVRGIRMKDLAGVAISTNDSGPWGADFWWLLYGKDGELACAFPEMATGDAEAGEVLRALPGFDFEAFGLAIGSCTDAIFPVWHADKPPIPT